MTQFSTRAQDYLNNPTHLLPDQKRPWKVGLDSGDKILTLSYSSRHNENSQIPPCLFCEVLCVFAINRSADVIDSFSYREVENFLRDENHLSAFSLTPSESLEVEKTFVEIKWQLFAVVVFELLIKQTGISQDYFTGWSGRSLVEKNRLGAKFIADLNTVIPLGKMVEFVFSEGDILHLKDATEKWSTNSLLYFMRSLLSEFNETSEIKVVAVQ